MIGMKASDRVLSVFSGGSISRYAAASSGSAAVRIPPVHAALVFFFDVVGRRAGWAGSYSVSVHVVAGSYSRGVESKTLSVDPALAIFPDCDGNGVRLSPDRPFPTMSRTSRSWSLVSG